MVTVAFQPPRLSQRLWAGNKRCERTKEMEVPSWSTQGMSGLIVGCAASAGFRRHPRLPPLEGGRSGVILHKGALCVIYGIN